MIDTLVMRKAWSLLPRSEHKKAFSMVALIILSGAASALMLASILPFLHVVTDRTSIQANEWLSWAYTTFGFEREFDFLIALGGLVIVMVVISAAIQVARIYVVARFATLQVHFISTRLLRIYLSQPYSYYFGVHSGDLSKTIIAESGQVVSQFFRPMADGLSAIFTLLSIFAFLLFTDPFVALSIFFLIGGIYAGIVLLTRRKVQHWGRRRVMSNGLRFKFANEALAGLKDLRIRGKEAEYLRRFEGPSYDVAYSQVVMNTIAGIPSTLIQAAAFTAVVILCLVLVENGEAGFTAASVIPVLAVFALAAQRAMPEFGRLYDAITKLQYSAAAVENVWDAANLPEIVDIEAVDRSKQIELNSTIELDKVSHAYPQARNRSLDQVTLQIKAGETIGVVGETGAGKSTFADLLMGLILPDEGQLRIDGGAIDWSNVRDWQKSVGYVPQDIFMADTSVAENIALGEAPEEIDRERVVASAKAASIDKVIESLPDRYDTPCGERGIRFSGGQKQRIGVARALYGNADLILFDEATSALDTITEREVMGAIRHASSRATIVIIAHRLSTVRECDRILVLERGRVCGFDTWDRLIASNEVFQRLVAAADQSSRK